ncbi:MAG: ABC transporter permease [Bacilli bacterium]|nr:ABC transporter permease [Bacilli bacterium]
MIFTYSLIDRKSIFANDPSYNRYQNNEKIIYENNRYQQFGYLRYFSYQSYLNDKYKDNPEDPQLEIDRLAINDASFFSVDSESKVIRGYNGSNESVKGFIEYYSSRNYKPRYLAPLVTSTGTFLSQPYLIAQKDLSVFERLGKYFGNFISIETTNDVSDARLTDRYIRWEWDKRSNMPALVGSGTTHKYLIYFDDQFPFVHQNIVHINLGISVSLYQDADITEKITGSQGEIVIKNQEYPVNIGTGILNETANDFHTASYGYGEPTESQIAMFGNDPYYNCIQFKDGLSMIGNSFIIGIISVIIAYLLGLPIGVWMARRKDKVVDKVGNLYIIFIMAVPSLAYIFIFAFLGTRLFNLPYKFANASIPLLGYILPTISLALPSIGSLMKWMRRYMIDQMNSDYVKFARSQGLSEGEIFSKHISRNAMIYLVHGIPGNILACLTGAIITESVYSVPGIGRLLTNAITKYDNSVIIACTVFYTVLSIVSLILGDLLLAKYDPRISFTEGGN